jgi:hypothetical protein
MPRRTIKPDTAPQDLIRKQLAQIYTPSVPIRQPELFSGRTQLLADLRDQLAISGRVFILYGERGVGKTSFCNVLLHDLKTVTYDCTEHDTFETIFIHVLERLGVNLTEVEVSQLAEVAGEAGAEGVLKVGAKASEAVKLTPIAALPLDQTSVLERLAEASRAVEVIVFDECQHIVDPKLHSRLNTLVKSLSDNHVPIHVFFVGVGESDEDLVPPPNQDYSEYKLRHYQAYQIPPMTAEEIRDILQLRKNAFNISFPEVVQQQIGDIACGYPSIAHTLALYTCLAWLAENGLKLLASWLAGLPFGIGGWLAMRGLKVEKIELSATEAHFHRAVARLLKEFQGNYPELAKQLLSVESDEDRQALRKILRVLASAEEGMSVKAIGNRAGVAAGDVTRLLAAVGRLVKHGRAASTWVLAFSHLRAVIRAAEYLALASPAHYATLTGKALLPAAGAIPGHPEPPGR